MGLESFGDVVWDTAWPGDVGRTFHFARIFDEDAGTTSLFVDGVQVIQECPECGRRLDRGDHSNCGILR